MYLSDGVTLVLIGKKIEAIFASTQKLYCDFICVCTTSKLEIPVLIRIRMMDFFVEIN